MPTISMPENVRRIRSFVRREGRLTVSQERALQEHWGRFGLAVQPQQSLQWAGIFGRQAPVTLEIGFGNGESLLEQVCQNPDRDFVGIEVHRPGVGHLLRMAALTEVRNLRVLMVDAVGVLQENIPSASLDCVQIFFPDPWPKKRHQKRRLIQAPLVQALARVVRPGGCVHLATDWQEYAQQMQEQFEVAGSYWVPEGPQPIQERPLSRPETRFERRGGRLGHAICDFIYRRADRMETAALSSP